MSVSHKRTDTLDTENIDIVGLDVSGDDNSKVDQVMYHPEGNLSGETIEETTHEEQYLYEQEKLGSAVGEMKTTTTDEADNGESEPDERFSFWSGSMIDSIQSHNGVVSKFSEEHMGPHALYGSFAYSNGWFRTLSYFLIWVALGWFFFFLSIPLIRDYQAREVVTTIDARGLVEDGLPLPIITVCPHGRGIRCDCTLWRRLYCRYQKLAFDTDDDIYERWTDRFAEYACFHEFKDRFEKKRSLEQLGTFDEVDTNPDKNKTSRPDAARPDDDALDLIPTLPIWDDPKCEDFDGGDDTSILDVCDAPKNILEENPSLMSFTGEELFKTIVARESEKDGPHITHEELILYASLNISDRVSFTEEKSSFTRYAKRIPNAWIKKSYIEWSRLQLCTQVRPPPEFARQRLPGVYNGIAVLITGINESDYPLYDISNAAPAVDVHINVIPDELYNRTTLPIESHAFTTVQAGSITSIAYLRELWTRSKGWGERASRTCADTHVPRTLCVNYALLTRVGEMCNCTLPHREYGDMFDVEFPPVLGCSATADTIQATCVTNQLPLLYDAKTISLDECPVPCESSDHKITSRTTTKITEPQMSYFKSILETVGKSVDDVDVESTAYVRVGLESLVTIVNSEQPKTTFGALMGQIGGNAGLWCGLSFTMLLEVLEFIVVAVLYGRGFYRPRRHSLRWWLTRKLKQN